MICSWKGLVPIAFGFGLAALASTAATAAVATGASSHGATASSDYVMAWNGGGGGGGPGGGGPGGGGPGGGECRPPPPFPPPPPHCWDFWGSDRNWHRRCPFPFKPNFQFGFPWGFFGQGEWWWRAPPWHCPPPPPRSCDKG